MTGNMVTSASCSGTCLIFSIARHPNVSEVDTAFGGDGRVPDTSAARTLSTSEGRNGVAGDVLSTVVMLLPPQQLPRRAGGSARGIPRRDSAGRGRSC